MHFCMHERMEGTKDFFVSFRRFAIFSDVCLRDTKVLLVVPNAVQTCLKDFGPEAPVYSVGAMISAVRRSQQSMHTVKMDISLGAIWCPWMDAVKLAQDGEKLVLVLDRRRGKL